MVKRDIENFWKYVDVPKDPDACWNWKGYINKSGYGTFRFIKKFLAHRFSYLYFVGEIPKGKTIDHLCYNRKCVNPEHLEPKTLQENIDVAINHPSNKTHCINGHEFNSENTAIVIHHGKPERVCIICRKIRYKNWYYKDREKRLLVVTN